MHFKFILFIQLAHLYIFLSLLIKVNYFEALEKEEKIQKIKI